MPGRQGQVATNTSDRRPSETSGGPLSPTVSTCSNTSNSEVGYGRLKRGGGGRTGQRIKQEGPSLVVSYVVVSQHIV